MAVFLISIITLVALDLQEPRESPAARKPNPFAPSLPELTDAEESKLDNIINRFIDADSGQLPAAETRQAVNDFKQLKPEAIPALIRGLNRAAKIEHSCPAVTIAAKLARMLRATRDPLLLEYARENIGAGITQSRHIVVIKDLRLLCTFRKRTLTEKGEASFEPFVEPAPPVIIRPGQNDLHKQPTNQLIYAASQETGSRLRAVLRELACRDDELSLDGLASAAAITEKEYQDLARRLLREKLGRLDNNELKKKLKDSLPEVRAAAALTVAEKKLHLEMQVVEMLHDQFPNVREAAHDALVRLANWNDFGPKSDASADERQKAETRWREWCKNQPSSKQ